MFNACVLIHRFFTYESFKNRDRLVRYPLYNQMCMPFISIVPLSLCLMTKLIGATAVFLGGKIAENPRRLLDVVGHYHALRRKTKDLPPEKSQVALHRGRHAVC